MVAVCVPSSNASSTALMVVVVEACPRFDGDGFGGCDFCIVAVVDGYGERLGEIVRVASCDGCGCRSAVFVDGCLIDGDG